VSKVVHTTVQMWGESPPIPGFCGINRSLQDQGYKTGQGATILPTETYRALVGALESCCIDDVHWHSKRDAVLALLREADTGEGT
jgi:hypothetical protein